ncbi:glycosyltransferase family 4 protein [Thalassotalea sp. ND16A]|uniref:glycosyltransferase family 4 protein n=1 Tax=Thalassotalea sp. ND16A TaxID=1535422 RepID=UPI00051A6443|nr:glycosyltransferase family 4 protein [Thalassotalea sp. ND16A]KGJ94233.1 hypothetical protein ND16A_1439 [Thalassotalea sp. ND16A]
MKGQIKRILIVSEYFYPEEFKINDVVIDLVDKGYEVDVITTNPTYPFGKVFDGRKNTWFSKDKYFGADIYRVKAVTGYKTSTFKKLLKYFNFMVLASIFCLKHHKRYDAVLGYDVGALTGMLPAALLKKFFGKKVTLWVQDIWPDSVYAFGFKKSRLLTFCLDNFVKFVYRHSSNFAISCPGFEDKVNKYCSSKKEIRFVPNWAESTEKDGDEFQFLNSNTDKVVQFTFAGNIGKFQNLENVIIGFSLLPSELVERAQLNIIGDGSNLVNLQKLVERKSIDNVIFHGRKPSTAMPSYYKGSDVLIISLIDEPIFSLTIPSKFQTYLAAGKPIFSIMEGEVSELVIANQLGLIASPAQVDAISEQFANFIKMEEETKKQYGFNGSNVADTLFHKGSALNNLENLLCK